MIFCERGENNSKIKKILLLHENLKNGNMKIKFVSPSDPTTDKILLVKIKMLFQKQLSKMPRGYILRQVFNKKHICLVILNSFGQVIGSICYRPFYHKNFIEIVFCAVNQNYQIKGIGSFMMDILKEHVKKEAVIYSSSYKEVFNKKYDEFEIDKLDNNIIVNDNDHLSNSVNRDNDHLSNSVNRDNDHFSNFANRDNDYLSNSVNRDNDHLYNSVNRDNDHLYNSVNRDNDHLSNTVNDVIGVIPVTNMSIDDLNSISTSDKLNNNIYLITYADNSAIGYFKKQGFTKEISFRNWIGYIKDYEGGTIMQCKIYWDVNYIYKNEMIQKKKDELLSILENEYGYNQTYEIKDYFHIQSYTDIPGVDSSVILGDDRRNRNNCLNGFIDLLISELKNDPSSWPFLEPVNPKDVVDYYDVIKNPIDLSKISKKFLEGSYKDLDLFISDIHLMLNNCYKFNSRETEYYKCALRLNDKLEEKLKTYEMAIRKWRLK